MANPPFKKTTIIGVGLIGGSLGLAIKRRFPGTVVTGVDRPAVLRKALARKVVDRGTQSLLEAVSGADLVILATPINTIIRLLPTVARSCNDHALITDVGSVKDRIMEEAKRWFPGKNFIGGHPMAGVEISGVGAAHPLLFENAVYVFTPLRGAPKAVTSRFSNFVRQLGARPLLMDPIVHDRVASAVSHVPQLTAVALMNLAGKKHRMARKYLRLAAGGFRDLTRIASSRFDLWSEILPMNRVEVAASLKLLIDELSRYRAGVKSGGISGLGRSFRSARKLRNSIPRDMKGFIHPLAEIHVFVKDRPGMLAKMTRALAQRKINIQDIELMKVREGRGGTFRLAFESQESAHKAEGILRKAGFGVAGSM